MGYESVELDSACVRLLGELRAGGQRLVQGQDLPGDRQDHQEHSPGQPDGTDMRAAPRFTLLIRAAKLIADGQEFLCIIRDASASGIKVRLFTPLPDHQELIVELATGDRHPAELVWRNDDYVGFRFLHPVAIERLLDESSGTFPRRQVRLRMALDAILHSGGEAVRIAFQDMSQQGACIECDKWLLMNELVRLETGVMPPIYAKIRWRSHPRYGLLFERTFKLDELARISAPLQLGRALREAARDGDETSSERLAS